MTQQRIARGSASSETAAAARAAHRDHRHDAHEQEADRNAQAIGQRGAACAVTPVPAPRGRDAGDAAAVPASPGQAMDDVTRGFMRQRLGRDFGDVRIHADESAARSAHERSAHAYTAGRHVVFGRGEYAPQTARGRQLLAHELTHVAQQSHLADEAAPVQHMGIGQFFARLFGEGTFSDDELEVYLMRLETQPGIEDKFDSDNKARAIVRKGMHKDLSLATRVKLVQEMLSGVTGDDDEQAILKILEDASPLDREVIVERVGYDRLDSKIDGEEHDRLLKLAAGMHRAGKQAVPTTWTMSYSANGANELRSTTPAIEVSALDATPEGEAAGRSVVTSQTVQSPAGSPQFLAGSFDHPRDKAGQGNLAFRVLPTDKDNKPIADDASGPDQLQAKYEPVSYDRRLVNAHLDVTYDRLAVQDIEHSSEHAAAKGHEVEQGHSKTESTTTGTGKKTTTGSSDTTGHETSHSDTQNHKDGDATTKSESHTKGGGDSRSHTHETNKSDTHTTGKSDTDSDGHATTHKDGESHTKDSSDTHTDAERSHKQLNMHLEGTVEGNLGDLLKSLAGKVITGGVLGKFLDRAGRPGAFLKHLIQKYNPIDMLLEGVGDSFTLKGTLKGDMAFEWETNTSDSHTTGKSDTTSSEDGKTDSDDHSHTKSSSDAHTKGSQDSTTKSTEHSHSDTHGSEHTESHDTEKGSVDLKGSSDSHTGSSGTETSSERSDTTATTKSSAQRDSTTDTDTAGTKVLDHRWIPIIKERSLTFTVK